MAVSITGTSKSFVGTGALAVYAPEFYASSSDQVRVTVAGVQKAIGDDYTVSNVGNSAGVSISGSFTLNAAVLIERITPVTQLIDTQNNETILADVIDAGFDKLTMIAQEQSSALGRAVLVPKGEAGLTLPAVADRAGKVLGFTASGQPTPLQISGTDGTLRADLASTDPTKGGALVLAENGKSVRQRFANSRMVSLFDFMSDAQIADVTSGTPALDVASCFQALVDYCDVNKYSAWIPEVVAKLGSQVVSKPTVRVMSDSNGSLIWTNTANCGWKVSGISAGAWPGYCRVELPQLVGPNDVSAYSTTKIYSVAGFLGVGFQVEDCIWSDFKVQQMVGWGTAVKMTNTTIPTDNNRFELGTIDLCKYGIYVESPVGATTGVGQSRFQTMNVFALFPIYIKAPSAAPGVFELQIDALGLTVAETGGTTIYFEGPKSGNVRITGRARNGYLPGDSPAGTPTTMRGPVVGGNGTGPGGEAGWADATVAQLNLQLDDYEPAAGVPMAIRMKGTGSFVHITAPEYKASDGLTPITLSTTQGEANFNGGVGGAAIFTNTRAKVSVVALAAGAIQTYYFYHQRLTPNNFLPLDLVQLDNDTRLVIRTENNAPTVKREAKVVVFNPTASAITQDVNFWLRVL